jgi:glycosyltransferase involved in cell wall biosynthesis
MGCCALRIGLLSLDYKPFRSSGLTMYAEDLARGLTERGHTVTVVAARRPGLPSQHSVGGVEVWRLPIDRSDWIGYSWRAAQWLERTERDKAFQVLHFLDVHFAYAYHGPFVASLWQSFRQRLTARGGGPYHTGKLDWVRRQVYYRLVRRFMERPSLGRAGRLIASCQSTREEFIAHYGVAPARIDLAVQGIDTELLHPGPTDDVRRRLGLDDCLVLLFVGYITPRKGLEYLLQAMCSLPENVHLVIVGQWEPAYRAYCHRWLTRLQDRVHELGFVPDEQKAAYYSLADVYVSPSYLEGFGITPIEAMACCTPPIVTSATSGPEEVGDAGIIVPPRDPLALAAAVNRLMHDRGLRQQLGQRGRERVVQRFTLQHMAALTESVYERFLNNAGPGP